MCLERHLLFRFPACASPPANFGGWNGLHFSQVDKIRPISGCIWVGNFWSL